jgi:hypothetical protein
MALCGEQAARPERPDTVSADSLSGVEVPETHYARSGGLAIAYQVHGEGDHDLLLNAGTASNIVGRCFHALQRAH